MEQYIPFSDKIIFDGVALLEWFFKSQTSVSTDIPPTPPMSNQRKVAAPIDRPSKESAPPQVPCKKWAKIEAPPTQFLGWKEVLHPSQLVAAAGQTPLAAKDTKQRPCHQSSEVTRAPCQRAEERL